MAIRFLVCVICLTAVAAQHRDLYINGPNFERINVTTIFNGLKSPFGAAVGSYQGNRGLFLSAFSPPAVYFKDQSGNCESFGTCTLTLLVGTGFAGITDGAFSGSSGVQGSISDPSRMVYVEEGGNNWLFVMDRSNGLIRVLDLNAKTVGTLRDRNGNRLTVRGNILPDNNPELDIKYNANYLYITDSSNVYNVTGTDGTILGAVLTGGVMRSYSALKTWQLRNDYDLSTRKVYVTSVAIDASNRRMFVSYSYQRHAIVSLPLTAHDYTQVSVVTTDGVLWDPATSVPTPINGNVLTAPPSGSAFCTFPMNMQFDPVRNALYWTEVFSQFSSGTTLGALGAVAVRRLQFATMQVDYLAGNVGSFRYIYGKKTGFQDGFAEVAQFSYPVTIAFNPSLTASNGGIIMHVVDTQNNAIRRVSSITDTLAPSSSPSISASPSRPTLIPTSSAPQTRPSPAPTSQNPTRKPSVSPSISLTPTKYSPPTSEPTMLNGECMIITLMDSFGDGWSGAMLRVDTPGHSSDVSKFEPMGSTPYEVVVCGSYSRPAEFGYYTFNVIPPAGSATPVIPNAWEISWKVFVESSGEEYLGDSTTVMVFNFDTNGFVYVDSVNIFSSNEYKCERCKHPKPKPKPQPRMLKHGKPPPPPAPEPQEQTFEIPFVLHDSEGIGWFDASGDGSNYYIFEANRVDVWSTGTLCGDLLKDDCAADLADGDYYFRVTGAMNPNYRDVSWTFCKQHGKAMQELSFSIVDGECIAGALRDAETIGSAPLNTQMFLSGHLLIANVFGPTFSYTDGLLVEDAIQQILLTETNVSSLDVMISSSCESKTGKFCAEERNPDPPGTETHRGLAPIPKGTSTWDVSYLVTIIAEQNGADGTKYKQVSKVSAALKKMTTDAVLGGEVQEKVQILAEQRSTPSLKYVHVNREEPLKLVNLNYVSSLVPTSAPVGADSGVGLLSSMEYIQVVDDSGMQVLLIGLVVGLPTLGLVAFWGMKKLSPDNVDLGKSAESTATVQKGAWQGAVFKDNNVSLSNNGRQSPVAASPKRNNGSSMSVNDLLSIPGRTPTKVQAPVVDDENSKEIRRTNTIDAQINPSRLLPQPASGNRDRFRVREGLAHHDLSSASMRHGTSEGSKVVL